MRLNWSTKLRRKLAGWNPINLADLRAFPLSVHSNLPSGEELCPNLGDGVTISACLPRFVGLAQLNANRRK
jgi:hypothetical protein